MASSFMVWLLFYVFQALHSHDSKKSGVKAKKKIKYINNINTMNKVLGTNLTLSWASQKYSWKQKANTERQLRKYGDIAMKASRHFRHYSVHPLPPKLTFWTGAKDEGCAVSFWNWWWLWWYTEPFIKKLPLILLMEYGIVVFVPLDCELDSSVEIVVEGNIRRKQAYLDMLLEKI